MRPKSVILVFLEHPVCFKSDACNHDFYKYCFLFFFRLPGIEVSKEEQLAQMQNLKKQLQMKKDLIAKYKELNLKITGLSGLHQAN